MAANCHAVLQDCHKCQRTEGVTAWCACWHEEQASIILAVENGVQVRTGTYVCVVQTVKEGGAGGFLFITGMHLLVVELTVIALCAISQLRTARDQAKDAGAIARTVLSEQTSCSFAGSQGMMLWSTAACHGSSTPCFAEDLRITVSCGTVHVRLSSRTTASTQL